VSHAAHAGALHASRRRQTTHGVQIRHLLGSPGRQDSLTRGVGRWGQGSGSNRSVNQRCAGIGSGCWL